MTDFTETDFPEDNNATARPGNFLKVLIVLTLIACAYMAFQTVRFAVNPDAQLLRMEKGIEETEKRGVTGFWLEISYKGLDMMRVRKDNLIIFAITDLAGLFLCAFGAWQMWKLQKTGYYMWLIGEFVPWIVSVVIIGSVLLHPVFLSGLILPVAFAIMYGTQLKHMK